MIIDNVYGVLVVAEEFDPEGDLEFETRLAGKTIDQVFLSEPEVLRLHSHLTQLLRSRGHNV